MLVVQNRVERIPTLPAVVGKLLTLYSSGEYRIDQPASLIERDAALSARLLRLANSPFYCFAGDIRSVGSATMVLGEATVKGIALGSSLLLPWNNSLAPTAVREIWIHSWLAAIAAKKLGEYRKSRCSAGPDALFTAALLHDIGKILLLRRKPTEYAKLLETSPVDEYLLKAEWELFCEDHRRVGFEALFTWNLGPLAAVVAGASGVQEVREEYRSDYLLCRAAHEAALGMETVDSEFLESAEIELARRSVEENRELAEEFYRSIVQKWT